MEHNNNCSIRISTVILSLLFACSSCLAKELSEKPFIEPSDFDKNIPTPESVIGFPPGERAVTYNQLMDYLNVLDKASDLVTLTEYGRTHEGRALYYLTITSRENFKRLDRIKADNEKISDPRKIKGDAEAGSIIDSMPAVAMLIYGIHGDELSSSDAALYIAYHLAASRDKVTNKLLDEIVIVIVPMFNPDGRERFLGQIRQMTGATENTDAQAMHHQALWSRGRGNHYLFDLNRDWLVQFQPETRASAELIFSWQPHLLVDSHEQQYDESYLFDPPREPINKQVSPSIAQWRKTFGNDQAKAFDKFGWSYYTGDWYSDWGPFYTNSWANLFDCIGILYEEPRADSGPVKKPTGQILTYRQTIHHHIISTFANLQSLADNRKKILGDYYENRKQAVSEDSNKKFLILLPHKDSQRWNFLIQAIKQQGIEVNFAADDFEAGKLTDIRGAKIEKKKFPKNSAIISSRQPLSRLLDCLLDFDPRLDDSFLVKERTEIANHRETQVYDVTAWNLPMACGIEGFWSNDVGNIPSTIHIPKMTPPEKLDKKANYAYLIDSSSSAVFQAIVNLFENKCTVRAATKPFQFTGKEFPRGTISLRVSENPENLFEILQKINTRLNIGIIPADTALVEDGYDLGTSKFALLTEPRVAIASQWPISPTSFGSVWFLLDHRAALKCSPINIQNIGRIDLRKYNVLILPDSGGLARGLSDNTVKELRQWIENGGTLIAIAGSAAFAADKDKNLSEVRLLQDCLDKLPEYQDALKREKEALNVVVDSNNVWGLKTEEKGIKDANSKEKKDSAPDKSKDDIEKLKRDDEYKRMFGPSGVFVTASIDPEQFISYGLEPNVPVFFEGSNCLMSKRPVRTAVRLADEKNLRLSGLLWPEARERMANSAYATIESVGNGQIILFAVDPSFRMWMPLTQRMLLNAVLLGPGLGTSPPMPW